MPIQYYNIIYTLVTVSLSILVIVDLIAYETLRPSGEKLCSDHAPHCRHLVMYYINY